MKTKLFLSVILASAFFNACNKSTNTDVIATIGNSKITKSYIEGKLMEISPDYQNYLLTKNGKKQFLDILINEKLILLDAKDSSIGKSERYKEQVGVMEKEFKRKTKEFKNYLLTKMWMDKLKSNEIKTSENEIKLYYAKNPQEVTIEQILLSDYKKAESIYKNVKSGKNFAKVAKKESMFTGIASGGRLPPMMRGEFISELEDMAFKMKTGKVQGIVTTKFGHHILKKIAQKKLKFDRNTKERIRRILEKKKFDQYIEKLQTKYKVEVLDEKYK